MAKKQTKKKATTPASKSTSPKKGKQKPATKTNAAGKKRKRKYKRVWVQVDKGEPSIPKDEFRYNHVAGHTNYLFSETPSQYKALGLTSEKNTFGKRNKKLKQNPQKGKTDSSYIRNGVIVEGKGSYKRKPAKSFKFCQADQKKADKIVRRYEKKQARLKKAANRAYCKRAKQEARLRRRAERRSKKENKKGIKKE